jgi:hypothetical protein
MEDIKEFPFICDGSGKYPAISLISAKDRSGFETAIALFDGEKYEIRYRMPRKIYSKDNPEEPVFEASSAKGVFDSKNNRWKIVSMEGKDLRTLVDRIMEETDFPFSLAEGDGLYQLVPNKGKVMAARIF